MAKNSKAAKADASAYMAALEHPLKPVIEALRQILRTSDPEVSESIKWNAPSYALADHFATFKLRPETAVQIVLHTGAKVKKEVTAFKIDDPDKLLSWAAPDRCLLTFRSLDEVETRSEALRQILNQWIAQL